MSEKKDKPEARVKLNYLGAVIEVKESSAQRLLDDGATRFKKGDDEAVATWVHPSEAEADTVAVKPEVSAEAEVVKGDVVEEAVTTETPEVIEGAVTRPKAKDSK